MHPPCFSHPKPDVFEQLHGRQCWGTSLIRGHPWPYAPYGSCAFVRSRIWRATAVSWRRWCGMWRGGGCWLEAWWEGESKSNVRPDVWMCADVTKWQYHSSKSSSYWSWCFIQYLQACSPLENWDRRWSYSPCAPQWFIVFLFRPLFGACQLAGEPSQCLRTRCRKRFPFSYWCLWLWCLERNAAGCQAVGAVSTRAASSRLVGLGEGEFLGIWFNQAHEEAPWMAVGFLSDATYYQNRAQVFWTWVPSDLHHLLLFFGSLRRLGMSVVDFKTLNNLCQVFQWNLTQHVNQAAPQTLIDWIDWPTIHSFRWNMFPFRSCHNCDLINVLWTSWLRCCSKSSFHMICWYAFRSKSIWHLQLDRIFLDFPLKFRTWSQQLPDFLLFVPCCRQGICFTSHRVGGIAFWTSTLLLLSLVPWSHWTPSKSAKESGSPAQPTAT